MHWILQENLFKEKEWETLVSTLQKFNIPYSVHKVVPFVGELIPEPDPNLDPQAVIAFGSYSLRHAAVKYGWIPGVYDLYHQHFMVQAHNYGRYNMLNGDAEIKMLKESIINKDTFIRPINDSKHFAGKVWEPEEWNAWIHSIVDLKHDYGNGLSPETLVQLCRPKEIYAEYRYWIVDDQIATRSLYKRGGRVVYSSEVDHRFDMFVLEMIRSTSWRPHRSYVMDVADTPEGIKIVELNTINASGFYAANIPNLVHALEWMEDPGDQI